MATQKNRKNVHFTKKKVWYDWLRDSSKSARIQPADLRLAFHNGISRVARGGAMGHLHPPNQNCLALDIIEFSNFIHNNLILEVARSIIELHIVIELEAF
jgi:hypothetical protein